MMEALRSVQVLPGPGEVLKLGAISFVLHPEYDALFVRECYPHLFEALVCKPEPTLYIVTGTPGIGKSWFFYYILARLLKSTQPPPFIVWEHMTVPNMAWCYTHETGEVFKGERTSFDDVLMNRATWYITDGVPPMLNCLARTVLLTPPDRKIYKEMLKQSASLLYMPCWELGELLACRRLLYGTVDETLAKELYQHYGGVARFVLQLPKANPSKGLDKLLEELHEAVASCDTDQLRMSVGSISTGPDVSHMLLHIVADENFKMQHLVFASKWVAEEFVKEAVHYELQGLVSLLVSTSGALKRTIYEAAVHAVLSKGGRFTAAPISYDRESFWRGIEEALEFVPCTKQAFFEDLPDTTDTPPYVVEGVYAQLQAGTKRGAEMFLAGEAQKLARTEQPEPAPPTQQQAQKLARAKGVVPAANARADKAQPANDAAAKKAAAGKDKGKQEAKRKEEAKPKEKAKGKGKEGKPAQPADGAAASKGAPPSLRR
ncbi:hypothetical protein CHLRE_04g212200v5 [Chlamydomonas reinhardtii]|nr:uncharacterized protein CHLRE_04g212200v5 [Chlamydomonas reinhardtii]PNW84002.1 hypothetical protein CHLRE_04g212200v5 [Chlamydomonas reinhardtii]